MIEKNLIKKFILPLIVILLNFSCGNSNTSNTENDFFEDSKTDDYAMLSETNNESQRIVEDLSGKVIILYEKDFTERITALDNPKGLQYLGQTPCIVELYADWCKPCGYLSQLLNELAPEYQGKVIFYKLNIDRARVVVEAFNVTTIPKILYFKPFGEVVSTVGYLNREELKKAIENYLLKP
jgi:thiol-disulfide isomerase/thioredoxin